MMVRGRALIFALLVGATATACNAVLGIEEGIYRGDGGAGQGASTSAGGTSATGGAQAGGGGAGEGGGGAAQCPPWDVDAACDPSLMEDPDNCCHPGRSCQGGDCLAGVCTPVLLDGDASTDTRGVEVRGDRVYWSCGGNQVIRSRLKDGTGFLEVATDTNFMPSLTTDDTYAYWTEWNGGDVRRAPLTGGGPVEVLGTVSATAGWGRIAVSPTRVFWATRNDDIGVWAAPIDTVTGEVFAVASAPSLGLSVQEVADPIGVAVDATHVYFTDAGGGLVLRRTIDSVLAEEDVAADIIAANQGGAGDLAVDATHVYWITGSEVWRRVKDGSGAVETLATGQDEANAIVVDDQSVYWVDNGDAEPPTGAVQRVNKQGGPVETLAPAQPAPWEISQDCTSVFWTNHNDFGTGEVWKVTK